MTIRTNDLALLDFFLNAVKTYSATKTTHGEYLILAVFVMKIKYSRVCDLASSASALLFIIIQPLKVTLNECLFGRPVTIATFTAAKDFGLCS